MRLFGRAENMISMVVSAPRNKVVEFDVHLFLSCLIGAMRVVCLPFLLFLSSRFRIFSG